VSKRTVLWIAFVVLLLWIPLYAEGFWLQTGLFAMSAAIGAIGLTLLVGSTGQLSLATAFFVAIGAYGYCFLAGEKGGFGGAISAPEASLRNGRPKRERPPITVFPICWPSLPLMAMFS